MNKDIENLARVVLKNTPAVLESANRFTREAAIRIFRQAGATTEEAVFLAQLLSLGYLTISAVGLDLLDKAPELN